MEGSNKGLNMYKHSINQQKELQLHLEDEILRQQEFNRRLFQERFRGPEPRDSLHRCVRVRECVVLGGGRGESCCAVISTNTPGPQASVRATGFVTRQCHLREFRCGSPWCKSQCQQQATGFVTRQCHLREFRCGSSWCKSQCQLPLIFGQLFLEPTAYPFAGGNARYAAATAGPLCPHGPTP